MTNALADRSAEGLAVGPSKDESTEASGASFSGFESEDKVHPFPICGCCRQEVKIFREKGKPYVAGGKIRVEFIERVIFPCSCREEPKCFLCPRCWIHCRCTVPALEKR